MFPWGKRDYNVANKLLICIDPELCKGNVMDPCGYLLERCCREEPARVWSQHSSCSSRQRNGLRQLLKPSKSCCCLHCEHIPSISGFFCCILSLPLVFHLAVFLLNTSLNIHTSKNLSNNFWIKQGYNRAVYSACLFWHFPLPVLIIQILRYLGDVLVICRAQIGS